MSFDRLIEKIVETQNPTVVGLDPKLDYVPNFIKEKACLLRYLLLHKSLTFHKIMPEAVAKLIAIWYDALLVAFSCNLELHLIQINVSLIQTYKFRQPYACRIKR